MPVFQVTERKIPLSTPPKKRASHLSPEWSAVIRFIFGVAIAGGIFALITAFAPALIGSTEVEFILLPVFVSLAIAQPQNYNFVKFLNSTPIYLVLTIGLTLLYCTVVTGTNLFIHLRLNSTPIILVTTTIAWAIIYEPGRAYLQRRIEERFNQRDRETARAIESFTSTLREEIDLDQLRERFLNVIQQTIQPYWMSLWICLSDTQQEHAELSKEVTLVGDDSHITYFLNHPGVLDIERLPMDAQFLQELRQRGAEVLLPLASQGDLIGLLILGPRLKGEAYTSEERSILNALAPQVAPALRVAQLVQERQEQIRERERIEQELRTARAIQLAFLPKDIPAFPGWHVVRYYQPAREVGGDFYDFLLMPDGRLAVIIGDVTGKGVPAALVMATVLTMLRTAIQGDVAPASVLTKVNDLLAAEIPAGMFVTCFFALLDIQTGRMCYANAGHELPFCLRDGKASELWATGMPLGMLPGTRYDEHEATLSQGECLLFYSDGLVEAHNSERDMFGLPRLLNLISTYHGSGSLIDFLLQELASFTGSDREQEDDVTLVVVQRTADL
jgi:serine phosphatase RsbU (regulator of sigma subunit)